MDKINQNIENIGEGNDQSISSHAQLFYYLQKMLTLTLPTSIFGAFKVQNSHFGKHYTCTFSLSVGSCHFIYAFHFFFEFLFLSIFIFLTNTSEHGKLLVVVSFSIIHAFLSDALFSSFPKSSSVILLPMNSIDVVHWCVKVTLYMEVDNKWNMSSRRCHLDIYRIFFGYKAHSVIRCTLNF